MLQRALAGQPVIPESHRACKSCGHEDHPTWCEGMRNELARLRRRVEQLEKRLAQAAPCLQRVPSMHSSASCLCHPCEAPP